MRGTQRCARVVLALMVALLMAGCGESESEVAPQASVLLRGEAALEGPIAAGRVQITDADGRLLQDTAAQEFRQGTFVVALGAAARDALDRTHLLQAVVVVDTGNASEPIRTLRRIVEDFAPDAHVVHLNALSTIVAAYIAAQRARGTQESIAALTADVTAFLGVDAPIIGGTVPAFAFDPAVFLAAASMHGGFDAYVAQVAAQIEPDSTNAMSFGGTRLGGLGEDAFAFIGKNIASGAIQGPVSHAFGFVLDLISGPDQNTRNIDDIKDIVEQNHEQLSQLQTAVSEVSQDIKNLRDEISQLIIGTAYEQRAAELQKEINTLSDLHTQLLWLAKAYDPADATFAVTNKSFIDTLLAGIQTNAHKVLLDIQTEMIGSTNVEGLISKWADLNQAGTGYPYFYNNGYLKKAVPHAQYYIGAQTLAFSLLAEYAHHLSPSLGQESFNGSLQDYYTAVDQELRAISANRWMTWSIPGIGTDAGYPAAILPDDDIVLDTTFAPNGTAKNVWTRMPVCIGEDGTRPHHCVVYVTENDAHYFNVARIQDYLPTFELGGLTGWSLPTSAEFLPPTECARAKFAQPTAAQSFIAAGFALPNDGLGYWTDTPFAQFPSGQPAPEGARLVWDLEHRQTTIPAEADLDKGYSARALAVTVLTDPLALAWLYRPSCIPSDVCQVSHSCQWCPPEKGDLSHQLPLPAVPSCTP